MLRKLTFTVLSEQDCLCLNNSVSISKHKFEIFNILVQRQKYKNRVQTFILQNNRTCEHGIIHITTDVHFIWLYYT